MSAIEEINAKLAEIGTETIAAANSDRAWANLTLHGATRPTGGGIGEIAILNADPDEYQKQGSVGSPFFVMHHSDSSASITFRGDVSTTEAVFALLERALDFVRTETPVPL